ncbi:hypothetical protein WR25_03341 isoform D [Diploscapter pachys]|uniref:Carboxylesterase type B domain-containing protein n=1 Tax=Diploscapter pachys TaxID=2018661 RepID=A0A2A2L3B1_9BILA|nr:hypothetical protein WR25_03341 isoform B [Diploscapter pachys]PAV80767.1 hypothetical protein WR25_03341 isoform C [Diploscapter pachys]PAV80768.1 hypothetical protein WR25_03341 isoform D [Diploscapter pachys]
MSTHQGLETLKSNGVKRPRQVVPRAAVYASTLPPRPTYPPFVFRPKPSPIGRDQADSNLLAEIEEYDDFLEQSLAYKAQYPQATIPNPYWFLPDGKLPRAGTHYLSQTSQPQAFGAALQQAVPQQNIIMPQYDAKGQTVVQTPQVQNNYQPYQQQQQYQNNYYGQQQQGQQYGQQSITPSVAAPAAAASASSASSAPDPLANPLLSLLNLFNFNTPSTGTAGATSQAHGVTTLVDVQQNPISFPTMGQTNMFDGTTVNAYLGVRYAQAPDAMLRFEKPVMVEAWDPLIHHATHFRASCIPATRKDLEDERNYSEDCLFLNIITPGGKKKDLPVFVYIHGGAFHMGDTESIGFEHAAENFVKNDIIFVSVQYRLGPFGFFSTGDKEIPGNMGLWDVTMALKFLHETIHAFGGDKSKITLGGFSAGSAIVSALLYSLDSDGLFSQAIQLSGSVFSEWAISEQVVKDSTRLAKAVGCSTKNSKSIHECMKERTANEILEGVEKIGSFRPYVRKNKFHMRNDGEFLTNSIDTMVQNAPKKRTLQGVTNLESSYYVFFPQIIDVLAVPKTNWSSYGKEQLKGFIKERIAPESELGSNAAVFYDLVADFYVHRQDSESDDDGSKFYLGRYCELLSDLQYNIPVLHELDMKRKHGWETYFYVTDYASDAVTDPQIPVSGVPHGSETRYLFGNGKAKLNEEDQKFKEFLVGGLVNFIKNGDPSTNSFNWPALTEDFPTRHVRLGPKPKISDTFRPEAYDFWTNTVPKSIGTDALKSRLPAAKAHNRHEEL